MIGDVIFQDETQKIIDIFYEYDCDMLFMGTEYRAEIKVDFMVNGEWKHESC